MSIWIGKTPKTSLLVFSLSMFGPPSRLILTPTLTMK